MTETSSETTPETDAGQSLEMDFDISDGEAEAGEGNTSLPPILVKKFLVPAAAGMLALLLAIGCMTGRNSWKSETDELAAEEMVSVTEAEKDLEETKEAPDNEKEKPEKQPAEEKREAREDQADSEPTASGKTAAEYSEMEKPAAEETEDLSWQETIFGNQRSTVMTGPITVSGLTENEKNLTGFRESDFIRSLSSFLVTNNTHTSAVTFTGSIACSAGEAAAYTADLKGVSDRNLVVLFFPKYPGKYLFALETVKKEESTGSKESESKTQVQTQTQAQTQTPVSQPAASQTPAAQSTPQTEPAYDAHAPEAEKRSVRTCQLSFEFL